MESQSLTVQSSRFTGGNFWFPDRLILLDDRVQFSKRKLIGGNEESILYSQISSVSLNRGVLFANIMLETTGGSAPIFLNGLWLSDAQNVHAQLVSKTVTGTPEQDRTIALLEEQNRLLQAILDRLSSS